MGRKSKSKERRMEILEHYYNVVIKEGYENSSIAKIAADMDVQPSLIMHYFKTKEEMTIALLEIYAEKYLESKIQNISEVSDLSKRLKRLINFSFNNTLEDKSISILMDLIKYLRHNNEDVKKAFNDQFVRFRYFAIKQMQLFYDNGIILNSNVEIIADMFILLHIGYIEYFIHGLNEKADSVLMEKLKKCIIDIMEINYEKYSEEK